MRVLRKVFVLALLALAAVPAFAEPVSKVIARAAAAQIGVTTLYDPSYAKLAYPGGDVPMERGVCADVVIRAFRAAGIDLQVEVHEDMKKNFATYPRNWGLRGTDRNIDHRRVPNLMKFFQRKGKALPLDAPYEPGDVVAWRLPNGLYHIGVVAEDRAPGGRHRYAIHNIGAGARREDVLYAFEILGHYRW